MSMLSEPRRKQKIINLRAKNNAWSNDNTKFGQRMLEKMGWSVGKGLGTKEDGIVEHVIARYKNDEKGLGYEDRNDQWTKHEDDFNSLLAELSHGSDMKEKLHSGVSLELKSKKSKARVHYHKFTRGKDLSRYSEKDLACIFGKKTLKKEDSIETLTKEEHKVINQVFTEKGSMEDYFKNKMASVKSALENENTSSQGNGNDNEDFGFRGFSCGDSNIEYENEKNESKQQPFSFYNSMNINSHIIDGVENNMTQNIHKLTKKKDKNNKKKKFTSKLSSDNVEDECNHPQQLTSFNTQTELNNVESKKKKKKGSHSVCSESIKKAKTKKKKKEVSSEYEIHSYSSKKRKTNGYAE